MLLSSALSAFMGLIVKLLEDYPLFEIVFFRNFFPMIILPLIILKMNIPLFGKNRSLLLTRSFIAFITVSVYFYTFTKMSLTDAITIRQLGPIIIALLSIILLNEQFHFKQSTIFIFAFLGTVLIVKPGMRSDSFPAIIGILSTFLYALSHVFVRKLRLTDHPLVIVNYFMSMSCVLSFMILIYNNNFIIPPINDLFIFLILAFISMGVQISLTKSYQLCSASVVSMYMYSQIIFGAIFDVTLLRVFPDMFSITGAAIIIISGYLNYRIRLRKE